MIECKCCRPEQSLPISFIAREYKTWTGHELRFLRKSLGIPPKSLGSIIGLTTKEFLVQEALGDQRVTIPYHARKQLFHYMDFVLRR